MRILRLALCLAALLPLLALRPSAQEQAELTEQAEQALSGVVDPEEGLAPDARERIGPYSGLEAGQFGQKLLSLLRGVLRRTRHRKIVRRNFFGRY